MCSEEATQSSNSNYNATPPTSDARYRESSGSQCRSNSLLRGQYFKSSFFEPETALDPGVDPIQGLQWEWLQVTRPYRHRMPLVRKPEGRKEELCLARSLRASAPSTQSRSAELRNSNRNSHDEHDPTSARFDNGGHISTIPNEEIKGSPPEDSETKMIAVPPSVLLRMMEALDFCSEVQEELAKWMRQATQPPVLRGSGKEKACVNNKQRNLDGFRATQDRLHDLLGASELNHEEIIHAMYNVKEAVTAITGMKFVMWKDKQDRGHPVGTMTPWAGAPVAECALGQGQAINGQCQYCKRQGPSIR